MCTVRAVFIWSHSGVLPPAPLPLFLFLLLFPHSSLRVSVVPEGNEGKGENEERRLQKPLLCPSVCFGVIDADGRGERAVSGTPGLHSVLGTGNHLLPSISFEYKQLWSSLSQHWRGLQCITNQALFQTLVLVDAEQWWEGEAQRCLFVCLFVTHLFHVCTEKLT